MIQEEITGDNNEDVDLYEHYRFVVDKGQGLLRIDKFLAQKIENISRTKIKNAAEAECILVNDKPVKSNYKVKPLDVVAVVMPHPRRELQVIPQNIPINILYEDDQVIVVDKEAGMVVHPGHGNYTGTLVNALTYHLQDLPLFQTGELRPGLVHRLDKNTSGIIVIAKTEYSLNHLSKQFYERTTDRLYAALVWGNLAEEKGTIVGNIGRSLKDRMKFTVYQHETIGKHAVTHYRVLEKLGYVNMVECKLETGRTHQIRVHFEHIGHPVFNDERYGGDAILKGVQFSKYKQFVENCFKIMPRHALHAKLLGFTHPVTKKRMSFESELPLDMKAVLEKWRRYISNRKDEE